MARLLACLPVPSHLLFLMVIKLTRDSFLFTGSFLLVYCLTAWLQVVLLICLAYALTHFLWRHGINPDNWAIPFMTAFADLIGSAMLAVAFIALSELQDENAFHPPPLLSVASGRTVGQLRISSSMIESLAGSSNSTRMAIHSFAGNLTSMNATGLSSSVTDAPMLLTSAIGQLLNQTGAAFLGLSTPSGLTDFNSSQPL